MPPHSPARGAPHYALTIVVVLGTRSGPVSPAGARVTLARVGADHQQQTHETNPRGVTHFELPAGDYDVVVEHGGARSAKSVHMDHDERMLVTLDE